MEAGDCGGALGLRLFRVGIITDFLLLGLGDDIGYASIQVLLQIVVVVGVQTLFEVQLFATASQPYQALSTKITDYPRSMAYGLLKFVCEPLICKGLT